MSDLYLRADIPRNPIFMVIVLDTFTIEGHGCIAQIKVLQLLLRSDVVIYDTTAFAYLKLCLFSPDHQISDQLV